MESNKGKILIRAQEHKARLISEVVKGKGEARVE